MKYDLLERTEKFAIDIRKYTQNNLELIKLRGDVDQLLRSSGSVGANYTEANDSLGKKDFLFRIRIARKEAKETEYWLKVIKSSLSLDDEINHLLEEASELRKILSAIINNTQIQK